MRERDRGPVWADPRDLLTRVVDTPCSPPTAADAAAWLRRAAELRTQVLAAAGLWDDLRSTRREAPRAEVFERTDHADQGYAIEKVYIESLPGYFVTGNLFRPSGATAGCGGPRRPAILNPHGHWDTGRFHHDALGSTFARCVTFARMGYVALAHDMAGYGDNTRIPHRWGDAGGWLWSASPLGLQLWSSVRCLDFLCTLPDVDPARLGCTGESGGGTQTYLLTAVDDRIRVSAPVNMISLAYQGGCVCENAPGLRLETSNAELAALAAPRPMLIVSCTGDWTLHTPRDAVPAIRAIYRLFGAEERVASHQEDAPHNYNRGSREAVYRFFTRWLPPIPGQESAIPNEEDILAPDPEDRMRVFAHRPWPVCPEGEAAEANVRAWFRQSAATHLQRRQPQDEAAVRRLRDAVLPSLQAINGVRAAGRARVEAKESDGLIWLRRQGYQDRCALQPLAPGTERNRFPLTLRAPNGATYAVWTYGSGGAAADQPWARAGRAALADHFLCYNRSDAAWAAHDLLTALAWTGGASELAASPGCAVPALLARAIVPDAIAALEVTLDPAHGWTDPEAERPWLVPGNYLPGVLRAGGLAGLLALAAPAVTRVHALRGHLVGVAAVYAALGQPSALTID